MSAVLEPPMTADEFLVWTETRDDDTRFELLDGAPVAMAPERADHGAAKFRIARRLADQIIGGGRTAPSSAAP